MSKLKIETLVDLPDLVFPLEESVSVKYIAGYFIGTSFHVLLRCDNYNDAKSIAESYYGVSHRITYVFKSIINLQKL